VNVLLTKKSLALSAALIVSTTFVIHAQSTSIDRIQHTRIPINNHLDRHVYQFIFKNKSLKTLTVKIGPSRYDKKAFRIQRIVTSKDIYNHPDFLVSINNLAQLYEKENTDVKINFNLLPDGNLSYSYSGNNPKSIKNFIDNTIKNSYKKLLSSTYYLIPSGEGNGMHFDYKNIGRSQSTRATIIERKISRLIKASTEKDKLKTLLDFVQSIPYDKSKMTNTHFRSPMAVLTDNAGDCDEKALLLSTMLKSAFPNLETKLLLTKTGRDDHAITLLEWREKNTPGLLHINNKYYLPLETTTQVGMQYIAPIVIKSFKANNYFIIDL
jgi:hypothetical protein